MTRRSSDDAVTIPTSVDAPAPALALAYDAVVLAGGRGSRLGGVVKPDVPLAGHRMLDRVLAAVRDAHDVVVVGSVDAPAGVRVTVEEPAFGGPAAGVAAGLQALPEPSGWTMLLACDLVHAADAVPRLVAAAESDEPTDGYCLADGDGHPQWLLGLYRTASLDHALAALGGPRDRSMRDLLAPLRLTTLAAGDDLVADIDTWTDHGHWSGRLAIPQEKGHQP